MYEEDLYDEKVSEVDRQYKQIKGREKVIKTLKFLSFLTIVVSLVVFFLCPVLNIGESTLPYYDFVSKSRKDGSIEKLVSNYLESLRLNHNCPELFIYLGMWYIFTKVIVLVIKTVLFILKNVIFGFFKLFINKKVTYNDKLKVVNKYKKQNTNALKKSFFKAVVTFIISLIVPTIGDILDFNDSASSVIYPIFYAIMVVFLFYIPFTLVPVGMMIEGVAFSITMLPITIATICAVVHALLGLIILLVNLIFKSRKIA